MIHEQIENVFKSETRSSGRKLAAEEKLTLASGSDTTIQAYVRATPPVRVLLTSAGVGAETFTARCSCSAAAKGQFCKHIWATLEGASTRYPDFFNAKRNIDLAEAPDEVEIPSAFETRAKTRAADYRKDQYEKQKTRAKAFKQERRDREKETPARVVDYPKNVAAALAYFTLNGFPMPDGPSEPLLTEARRKLSRVFHPDKGGTHAEIVELNEQCEVLTRFLGL